MMACRQVLPASFLQIGSARLGRLHNIRATWPALGHVNLALRFPVGEDRKLVGWVLGDPQRAPDQMQACRSSLSLAVIAPHFAEGSFTKKTGGNMEPSLHVIYLC